MTTQTVSIIDDLMLGNETQDETQDKTQDTGVRRHRWTRSEVTRALEAGILTCSMHTELIAGELIEKMTQNRPHGISLSKSQRVLEQAFGPGHYISVQTPLAVDDEDEPEPDLMVVIGEPDDYASHPSAGFVRLVMEISDTTARYDRTTKARLYAQAGVTDYWLLDLRNRTLEIRREPILLSEAEGSYNYRSLTLYRDSDTLTPQQAGITDVATIRISDLLPRHAAIASAIPANTEE